MPSLAGVRYLDDDEIRDHLVACTRAGLQAGFHCIGDDAVSAAVQGLRRAAEIVGLPALRAAGHRLEHVEMVDAEDLPALAELAVTASVQPAFDAAWGAPGELYEQRLGPARSAGMNPFGSMHRAGVALAFGTDAPVTPVAGWAMVHAAVRHSRVTERLSAPDAFAAATRGGHRAAGQREAGVLAVGQPAAVAVWDCSGFAFDAAGLPGSSTVTSRAAWPWPSEIGYAARRWPRGGDRRLGGEDRHPVRVSVMRSTSHSAA